MMECPYCKENLIVVSGVQVHEVPTKDCPLLGQISVVAYRRDYEKSNPEEPIYKKI
jgi:hypothetical protein